MKTRRHRFPILAGLILAGGLALTSMAAEMRTWTSIEGKTLQGIFERMDGDNVVVKGADGRSVTFPKSRLSQADIAYLKDIGADTPPKGIGFDNDTKKPEKMLIPAKEVKVDTKTFVKKKGVFIFQDLNFDTVETPHFFISSLGKAASPIDAAENAERLWHEMAFYHPGFAEKWGDKRMAVFFVEKDKEYQYLGDWYIAMLKQSGNQEAARSLSQTWMQSSGGAIRMDPPTMEKYGTHSLAPIFRVKEPKLLEGVWSPFRTHVLSQRLLDFMEGGVQQFASDGDFAISTGFAYFKEIQLCGRTETALLGAGYEDGDKTKQSKGFAKGNDWAGELKSILRKGEYVKEGSGKNAKAQKIPVAELVSLKRLWKLDVQRSTPADLALLYGLVAYMHSSQDNVKAFAELVSTIEKSSQIPSIDDMAKGFGHADAAAFETAWLEWMKSGQFK